MFPGVVLQGAREECLREVEARYPEDPRYAVVRPVLHELHSKHQILNPRRCRNRINDCVCYFKSKLFV